MLFVLLVLMAIALFPQAAWALLQDTQAVVVPRGATAGWVGPWWVWLILAIIIVAMIYVFVKGRGGRGNP